MKSHPIFSTTIPPPPPFFNPLLQQATPTLTPTNSEATTSFPSLLDFSSVFKFNDRVANLEKDLSEIKQVDQAILKEVVNTQLLQILPQAVSDFATLVIEKNVTESLEAVVLARSSSQPKSTYKAAASLFEFELTKIFIDKMKKNKSYDKADYKMELYDALRSSTMDKDKDQDPPLASELRDKKKESQARKLRYSRDQGLGKRSLQELLKMSPILNLSLLGKVAGPCRGASHTVDVLGSEQLIRSSGYKQPT
ncbi:hypothetical protein Tco_0882814 [Tanacetum coccineum]